MLERGPAVKVTIHLNRDTAAAHSFLAEEIFGFLQRKGIEGATMIHAHSGFGAHRRIHTEGAGDVAGLHLPVQIYFIEQQATVEPLLEELLVLVTDGLVEVQETTILKSITSSEKVIS